MEFISRVQNLQLLPVCLVPNTYPTPAQIAMKKKAPAIIKTLVQIPKPPADAPLKRIHKLPPSRIPPAVSHPPIDEESLCGHFGWHTIQQNFIPYLFRDGKKYCSARMFELVFLIKYLSTIKQDVYINCATLYGYQTTPAEEKLLCEINNVHCDNLYGLVPSWHTLVDLEEAEKYLVFLTGCYNTLFLIETSSMHHKCGFLMVDKSIVSYVICDDKRYVPLLYFDGIEQCKLPMLKLRGWNLSYLKLCFKIQKLRDDYIKMDECAVGCLDDIKGLFPPNTTIQDVRIKTVSHCTQISNSKIYMNWFQTVQ